MNKILKLMIIAILLLGNLSFFSQPMFAEKNDYSVRPILPENQKADVQSYFDLVVTPDSEQTLKIAIKNNTSSNQKYNVYVNTATTNQNGIIDYSIYNFKKDESMVVSLKDCITLDAPQVDVLANDEKEVAIDLKIPKQAFNGVLLGGVTVEPIVKDSEKGISNVITRTIAIQLSESTEQISPELKVGDVTISQENYRNNIKINLRNVSPIVLTKVTAKITVEKKGEKKPLISQQKEQLSFAPNSRFNLMTEWDREFDPGEYKYTIKLYDESGHKWLFDKDFEIGNVQAENMNKTSVDKKKASHNTWIIYIGIGIAIIIMLGFMLKKEKRGKYD